MPRLRVVFLEPSLRGLGIRENLEVSMVSDLLARIHINEHGHLIPGFLQGQAQRELAISANMPIYEVLQR